jgi:hypothetical protein
MALQKTPGGAFQKDVRTIGEHIRNIIEEGELTASESVIRKFRITAADGKTYQVDFYNLDVIISVGYRVKSHRGTQFRIWATQQLRELPGQGLPAQRREVQAGPGVRQLLRRTARRIRDIRSSEKVFWRKVLDIYADQHRLRPAARGLAAFFATVQNKMHWAAHGHTAAEIIHARATPANRTWA